MPVQEGQRWSPELGDSQSDTRELTEGRALPNSPPPNRAASPGSSKSSDAMSMALVEWGSLNGDAFASGLLAGISPNLLAFNPEGLTFRFQHPFLLCPLPLALPRILATSCPSLS